jgi:hypothetical protein
MPHLYDSIGSGGKLSDVDREALLNLARKATGK